MLRKLFFALYLLNPLFFLQVEARSYSVKFISEEKVYVEPKALRMTEQELYLETGPGSFFALPALFSDDQGFYVPLVSMHNSVRSAVGYCTRCEDWVEVYYPSRFCPKCGKKILDAWPLH